MEISVVKLVSRLCRLFEANEGYKSLLAQPMWATFLVAGATGVSFSQSCSRFGQRVTGGGNPGHGAGWLMRLCNPGHLELPNWLPGLPRPLPY